MPVWEWVRAGVANPLTALRHLLKSGVEEGGPCFTKGREQEVGKAWEATCADSMVPGSCPKMLCGQWLNQNLANSSDWLPVGSWK